EEPRAVERIQVDEDRELQRQGQRRRAGQRGCHWHGHIAPPVLLCAHGSVHASVISLKTMENHTQPTFRPETNCFDVKRRLPPYTKRETSRRRAGSVPIIASPPTVSAPGTVTRILERQRRQPDDPQRRGLARDDGNPWRGQGRPRSRGADDAACPQDRVRLG